MKNVYAGMKVTCLSLTCAATGCSRTFRTRYAIWATGAVRSPTRRR